jgi:toxin ParE1/3/4
MKRIVRRALADTDILVALDYYIANAPEYMHAFIDDIEHTMLHIQQYPASGSTHYAHALDLPGLRVWCCNKYPYLIFYIENVTQIEIWRILHAKRDIPTTLQEEN